MFSRKQWCLILGILCFAIMFGIPFIIHLAFKYSAPNDFMAATWESADILQYITSVLSFITSGVLGIITLKLSEKLTLSSDKIQIQQLILEGYTSVTIYAFFVYNEKDSLRFLLTANNEFINRIEIIELGIRNPGTKYNENDNIYLNEANIINANFHNDNDLKYYSFDVLLSDLGYQEKEILNRNDMVLMRFGFIVSNAHSILTRYEGEIIFVKTERRDKDLENYFTMRDNFLRIQSIKYNEKDEQVQK